MTFRWTPHRFVGGALALDLANTVILRHLPERRTDRLADPEALAAFPQAASLHSAEGQDIGILHLPQDAAAGALLALREAIDAYFRQSLQGEEDALLLAALLERVAECLRRGSGPGDLLSAAARSALRLISDSSRERMKICGHCGWLFLDRSRNRSRIWCDMAVCGNREKASRHYAAHRVPGGRGRENR